MTRLPSPASTAAPAARHTSLAAGQPPAAPAEPLPVQAWLVDLDGTLYHAGPVRLCMAAELLLCAPAWIGPIRRFRKLHELVRQGGQDDKAPAPPGRLPPPASDADVPAQPDGSRPPEPPFSHPHAADPYQRQVLLAAQQLRCDAGWLAAGLEEWMQRRPGKWLRLFRRRNLLRALAQFRAQGGRTALVSDYPARAKLAALGVAELFEVVVASGEPGGPRRLKPDPEGYLLAAQRLGVPPAACLVLGDRDDADGQAARAAGMAFHRVRWM